MKKPSVYLETSVVSYAASRPSRDIVVASHQQVTKEWFSTRAVGFELFVSQLVVRESLGGDNDAARARELLLSGLPRLAISNAAADLARGMVDGRVVPRRASEDALHIAIAAVHGIDYLLTWNCKHIANARMRHAIDAACRASGYEPPVICTPEELMNDDQA